MSINPAMVRPAPPVHLAGLTTDTTSRRPRFRLDPSPFFKLPKDRALGPIMCVDIGPDGHVWIVHTRRQGGFLPSIDPALLPEVVEFDEAGNFIQAWGGPDHLPELNGAAQWPQFEETIAVDSEGCVWLFGSRGTTDHGTVRFSPKGEPLLRLGRYDEAGADDSRERLGCPTDVYVDAATREAFFADGYVNHRVACFDVDTGAFKHAWGAYGQIPPPTSEDRASFHVVHSVNRGPDGYLYVCDRMNNRVQVFDAIGKDEAVFIRELDVAPYTLLYGSAAEVEFSPDGAFMYIADNSNACIWIASMASWEVIGWFGGKSTEGSGNAPGSMSPPHKFVADRAGNLLVARVASGFERYLYEGVS